MAELLYLSSEEIENSVGLLKSNANDKVLEAVGQLAAVLKDSGDDNVLVQQTLDAALKFQSQYNNWIDSVNKFIKDAMEVYNLSEWVAKSASVGEVKSRDTSFDAGKMDTSSVIM